MVIQGPCKVFRPAAGHPPLTSIAMHQTGHQMTTRTTGRRLWGGLPAIAMFALPLVSGLVPLTGDAVAQQKRLKEQLVGTWALVSNTTTLPYGNKADTWGPNPKGQAIYESNGRMSWIITASNLPELASNNRVTGTPDENKAVVVGSIAYFGTYAVNEADKSYIVQIEGSTFPNWAGTAQKRMIEISGDEFTFSNPAGSGGGSIESKWKRVM
jgi:Lipocalin-like domain